MNWITGLIIFLLIGEVAAFFYLMYLVWREFSFTLKDASRLKQPIESFVQEGRRLQPLIEQFSIHMNRVMNEVQVIGLIARDTSQQVRTLAGVVGELRSSPNVKLAVRYGRHWIEERRANPIVRKLKAALRKLKKKFAAVGAEHF